MGNNESIQNCICNNKDPGDNLEKENQTVKDLLQSRHFSNSNDNLNTKEGPENTTEVNFNTIKNQNFIVVGKNNTSGLQGNLSSNGYVKKNSKSFQINLMKCQNLEESNQQDSIVNTDKNVSEMEETNHTKASKNGLFEKNIKDGSKFIANYKNNVLIEAQYSSTNGTNIQSNWNDNNLPHGKAKIKFRDDSEYYGNIKSGVIEGKGQIKFSDNSKYVGDFSKNNFNGFGIYYFEDGSKYEGNFVDGIRHCKSGILIGKNFRYEGAWNRDRMNGHGKLIFYKEDKSISSIYEGMFRDDKMHGNGSMHFMDGRIVKGAWKYGDLDAKSVKLLVVS